jgi:HEAT repeat protein
MITVNREGILRNAGIACLLILSSLLAIGAASGQQTTGTDVSQLIEQLKDEDESVRWRAAEALGKMGAKSEGAISALKNALNNDPNKNVRMNAAEALGRIGPPAKEIALTSLVVLLNDQDKDVRWGASSAITGMGEEGKTTIPGLAVLLQNTQNDKDIRWRAASALGGISGDPKSAVPMLINALNNDPNENVRVNAAEALGRIGPDAKDAVSTLIGLLKDSDKVLRRTAASALGEIGVEAKEAIHPLLTLLKDANDKDVQWRAAAALGGIGVSAKDAAKSLRDSSKEEKERAGYLRNLLKDAVEPLRNLLKGPDNILRRGAASALGSIGPGAKDAVPDLINALNNDIDENVRWRSAEALGKIGADAKEAIPLLAGLTDHPIKDLRIHAASALADISTALFDVKDTSVIAQLKQAEERLRGAFDADVRKHAVTLERDIGFLESLWWQQVIRWINDHRLLSLAIAVYPLLLLLSLAFLWIRPGWLWQINEALPESIVDFQLPVWLGGSRLPLRYALLIGFFRYHPRVLDAWVAKHIASARKVFSATETVEAREIYIPVPVNLNRTIIADLKPDDLESTFAKSLSYLLIWGEGGSGKTSLACLLAKWAMSADRRLCRAHFMLPVLIEQNLELLTTDNQDPFLKVVGDQVRGLIDRQETLSPDLLKHLLARGRILVMVDSFSEMSELSRKTILSGITNIPANAVIITSRTDEPMNNLPKSTIQPMRIGAQNLLSFMDAYLIHRQKRQLFEDDDFVAAYRSLSIIVGDREITVLLAKMYVEQMISTREEATSNFLPSNMPDLMLNYINTIYRAPVPDAPSIQTVHQAAEIIAWECLKKNFRPMPAQRKDVLAAMGGNGEGLPLITYLERDMKVIQTVGAEQDVRFVLDPLSEYLAGLQVVKLCGASEEKWRGLLSESDEKEGAPVAIKGFLLALRDCCLSKGARVNVPVFVADELARRAGLDPQELKSIRIKRKIKLHINDLKSPDAQDRVEAAMALARMKMEREVETGVAALTTALKDDEYKVVRSAAEALGDIGPAAEASVPALIELLDHDDHRVVSVAVGALGRIGPRAEAAVPMLVKLLKDQDNEQLTSIRSKVRGALKKIGVAVEASTDLLTEEDDEGYGS